MARPDYDETARLLLMDEPDGLIAFHRAFVAIHPGVTATLTGGFWGKYRGWDGRTRPTHDYVTGKHL